VLLIREKTLQYNSPLDQLRREQQGFQRYIEKLKDQLEYRATVVTKLQVDQSIKEIRDRVNQEMLNRLRMIEEKANRV